MHQVLSFDFSVKCSGLVFVRNVTWLIGEFSPAPDSPSLAQQSMQEQMPVG